VIEHDTLTRETLALMLQYYGYDVRLAQKPIDPPILNQSHPRNGAGPELMRHHL
jgi:hypothetical protein